MDLIYDAELTVNSVIDNLTESGLPDGDPEINIFTTDGFIKYSEDAIELSYVEKNENDKTFCKLTVQDQNRVSLSRKGAVDCDLSFIEGETVSTIYSVPPYSFDMTVKTAKIRNSLTKFGGELQLIYSMNIGGQDKKVRMKISVKART